MKGCAFIKIVAFIIFIEIFNHEVHKQNTQLNALETVWIDF